MAFEAATVIARIDALLAGSDTNEGAFAVANGAVSLSSLVRGDNSAAVRQLMANLSKVEGSRMAGIIGAGALRSLRGDIEAGLVGDLQSEVAGGVLGDFVALARAALDETSTNEGCKNVAAVLVAAAYEDTIRRMGERLAGVSGPVDLADVLTKIKEAGVIVGPQVGIAQAYLSFRNNALHARWDKLDRTGIESCLGFVEQLLMKHFA